MRNWIKPVNQLLALNIIHRYIEVLDHFFGNVNLKGIAQTVVLTVQEFKKPFTR
ncbi:hypothetical protein LPJ63_002254 [Coemansia sp. RSA 2711]|nr:hypothetical protein LPJ63_002254 [Coemansia sp. RSA 2711]